MKAKLQNWVLVKFAVLLLILTIFSFSTSLDAQTIPSNTWVNMLPTFDGGAYGNLYYYQKTMCIQAWNNKGVYDPISKRVMVYERFCDSVHGGSIYANALWAYNPVTNVVSLIKVNNWHVVQYSNHYETQELPSNATDPTPIDRHPLGDLALATGFNKVYLGPGLNQSVDFKGDGVFGNAIQDTWAFDLTQNTWSEVSSYNTLPPNPPSGSAQVMTYDTLNKVVVYMYPTPQGPKTWLLDPALNTWTDVPIDPSASGIYLYGSAISYDTKRNRVVILGSGYDTTYQVSKQLVTYDVATNKWTSLASCPVWAPCVGFDYDQKNDIFLALIDSTTWIYKPQTDTWFHHPANFKRLGGNGYWNRQPVTYDVEHNVFVLLGGNTGYGEAQFVIFRYDETTVGINNQDESKIVSIYPNPTNGIVKVQLNETKMENNTFSVFDMTGQLVYRREIVLNTGSNSYEIDFSTYPKGIYTLKKNSSSGVTNKKIIVQ